MNEWPRHDTRPPNLHINFSRSRYVCTIYIKIKISNIIGLTQPSGEVTTPRIKISSIYAQLFFPLRTTPGVLQTIY